MMNFRIITPEKVIINEDSIDYIHVTLSDGNPISIYPGHAPLIALLAQCSIKYEIEQNINEYSVSEGLIKVKDDSINCFVSWAKAIETEKSDD